MNSENLSPCEAKVVNYMGHKGSITALEAALYLHCLSLPQRIFDLKAKGWQIKKEDIHKKNENGEQMNYARYSLV